MIYWLVGLLPFLLSFVLGYWFLVRPRTTASAKTSAARGTTAHAPHKEERIMPAQPKKVNRIAQNAKAIAENETGKLRFDARLRGYDPAQVDAAIDALRAEIDRLQAELR